MYSYNKIGARHNKMLLRKSYGRRSTFTVLIEKCICMWNPQIHMLKPMLLKGQLYSILSLLFTHVGTTIPGPYFYDFTTSMFSQFCRIYIMESNGYFALCWYSMSMNTSIRLILGTTKK